MMVVDRTIPDGLKSTAMNMYSQGELLVPVWVGLQMYLVSEETQSLAQQFLFLETLA